MSWRTAACELVEPSLGLAATTLMTLRTSHHCRQRARSTLFIGMCTASLLTSQSHRQLGRGDATFFLAGAPVLVHHLKYAREVNMVSEYSMRSSKSHIQVVAPVLDRICAWEDILRSAHLRRLCRHLHRRSFHQCERRHQCDHRHRRPTMLLFPPDQQLLSFTFLLHLNHSFHRPFLCLWFLL